MNPHYIVEGVLAVVAIWGWAGWKSAVIKHKLIENEHRIIEDALAFKTKMLDTTRAALLKTENQLATLRSKHSLLQGEMSAAKIAGAWPFQTYEDPKSNDQSNL